MKLHNGVVERNGWLARIGDRVMQWATRKGWEDQPTTFGEEIALLHSEMSEVLKAYRRWEFEDVTGFFRMESYEPPRPQGVGPELANVLIRLVHCCTVRGIDLEWEFERAMEYNESQHYRHGKKHL